MKIKRMLFFSGMVAVCSAMSYVIIVSNKEVALRRTIVVNLRDYNSKLDIQNQKTRAAFLELGIGYPPGPAMFNIADARKIHEAGLTWPEPSDNSGVEWIQSQKEWHEHNALLNTFSSRFAIYLRDTFLGIHSSKITWSSDATFYNNYMLNRRTRVDADINRFYYETIELLEREGLMSVAAAAQLAEKTATLRTEFDADELEMWLSLEKMLYKKGFVLQYHVPSRIISWTSKEVRSDENALPRVSR